MPGGEIAIVHAPRVVMANSRQQEAQQRRAIVSAILTDDACAVRRIAGVRRPQLAQDVAVAAMRQAFLADEAARRRRGAPLSEGGLLSAMWLGLTDAQYGLGEHDAAEAAAATAGKSQAAPRRGGNDNATTVLAQAAVQHDDVGMLAVLFAWEPNFRMVECVPDAAHGEPPPPERKHAESAAQALDTTAKFMRSFHAPRCAAHVLTHRAALTRAALVDTKLTRARAQLQRFAATWLRNVGVAAADEPAPFAEVRRAFLQGVAATPMIWVHAMLGVAFTCGFALLGSPELLVLIGECDTPEAVLTRLRSAALRALAEPSHEASPLTPLPLSSPHHPFLDPLIAPFAPLRAKGAESTIVVLV